MLTLQPTVKIMPTVYDIRNDLDVRWEIAYKIFRCLKNTEGSGKNADGILYKILSIWEKNCSKVVPYSVEVLYCKDCWRDYWYDVCGVYINTGDTYSPTILYNVSDESYELTSMGDFLEYHDKSHLTEE